MFDPITWLGTLFSFIGMSLSLTGKSDAVKYQSFKDKGRDMKESKQLGKAMLWYKKALDYAETNENKQEIWFLIMHIHTDRLIGASEKFRECAGFTPEWDWGPNKIPSNYDRPAREELLK